MIHIQRIKCNLFPAAHAAIEDWNNFKWHVSKKEVDTYRRNSSQALVIDYFGTLKTSVDRDIILNSLAYEFNLPKSEKWNIELEWQDEKNLLNERRKSQIDAVAFGEKSTIFFESKFTEPNGGQCSQPKKKKHNGKLIKQCNGNYEDQVNPTNSILSKCALTGKCIRYWEIIPRLFKYEMNESYKPCPFKGSNYQWMRNVVLCDKIAKFRRSTPKFIILYADAPGLPMADKISSGQHHCFQNSLRNEKCIKYLSYQELLKISVRSSKEDKDLFIKLEKWILDKIKSQVKIT